MRNAMKFFQTPTEVINLEMVEAYYLKPMTRQDARTLVPAFSGSQSEVPYQVVARAPGSTYLIHMGSKTECETFLAELIRTLETPPAKKPVTRTASK